MKFLKYVAVVLTLVIHFAAQAQTNELKAFLKRFETYTKTHYPKVKYNMPIAKPESSANSMLEAGVVGFTEDSETGLRYYARNSIVYDPKTGYYLAYDPDAKYQVDIQAGKIFKGETEVKVKKRDIK